MCLSVYIIDYKQKSIDFFLLLLILDPLPNLQLVCSFPNLNLLKFFVVDFELSVQSLLFKVCLS